MPRRCSPRAGGRRWPGCYSRCPGWPRRGCSTPRTPSTVSCRTGSTRWIRCCARACSAPCWVRPAPQAPPGSARPREAKTIRRKIGLLAAAGRAGDWIAAMARRHVEDRPEQAAVCYVDGDVRAYQGARRIAKAHVPRLKFPAPATVETWVCDAAGDPLLVVMAQPAASLAAELRRLIPELRAVVGDDRRVLVGFDRGGWSATLFADLHAA